MSVVIDDARKKSSIIAIHACTVCTVSIFVMHRCSIIVCRREYRLPPFFDRGLSVIAKRRAMTHDARINRESDVARVIPTRKENISPAEWGRKKYFLALSRPSGPARQMRRTHRLLADEWSINLNSRFRHRRARRTRITTTISDYLIKIMRMKWTNCVLKNHTLNHHY